MEVRTPLCCTTLHPQSIEPIDHAVAADLVVVSRVRALRFGRGVPPLDPRPLSVFILVSSVAIPALEPSAAASEALVLVALVFVIALASAAVAFALMAAALVAAVCSAAEGK